MKVVFIVAALAVLGAANAACPQSCSGHGTCGQYDKCTCWANWRGADCGQRTCEYGNAWAENNVDPHYYAECSNKGICDRATGECQCFPEFDGRACERLSCPNQCSGHGKCRYITDMTHPATYSGWDATKIQTCICDGGFYGPDCSQRFCPQGDDPLTVCNNADTQIQRLELEFSHTTDRAPENTELALKFNDTHGELWKTQRISNIWSNSTTNGAPVTIKAALEALPNHVIPSVTVSVDDANDHDDQKAYLITFTDAYTPGDQNLLMCHDTPLGCTSAGCQPNYKQLRIVEQFVDVFAQLQEVQITSDSILTAPARGAGRWTYDANITITVHDNSTAGNNGAYFSYIADANDHYNTYSATITNSAGTVLVADGLGDFKGAIPIDFSNVYIGYGMYVNFRSRLVSPGRYSFAYSLPTCTITQDRASAANNENSECANRGDCDASTGVCACYEGFYGSNCKSQTILI